MKDLMEKKEISGLAIESPEEFVSTITRVADTLKSIIEKQKLYATINNKKFVTCEGWTTLASLCGFIPSINNIEVIKDGDVIEAKAEAVLLRKGVIVSKAIAFCRSDEARFGGKRMQEKFEIVSMAQTRAVGKVCRISLSWVMTMAGYEPTPAEEMDAEVIEVEKKSQQTEKATEAQIKAIHAILNRMNLQTKEDKLKRVSSVLDREVSSIEDLTKFDASIVIDKLQKDPF